MNCRRCTYLGAYDILMVTSNVNMEILDSFNKAGIDFAFPTRTIYVEKDELADLAKEKK